MGYGVLDELLALGCRVPEDYSLCAFDNVFPSAFRRVGLTSVEHFTQEHGARAFHLLREKMENRADRAAVLPITRVEYRSERIVRDSTAAPRKEEPHAAL